ncbi:MAG: hypothetical protein ACI8Q1_000096 [Parvicella sp.]|jgi:uncharacterized protein involved in exopolysaccharide biosynthesis
MEEKNRQFYQQGEIDFIKLSKYIWSKKQFIIFVSGSFLLLGLLIAFTSKVEYVASAKLMSESQKGISPDLGGLGGLAGLAGINLNMNQNSSLTPELYPEIVKSTLFIESLIHTAIYFEKIDTTISAYYYFKELDSPSLIGLVKEYTIGLPGKIKTIFSSPVEGTSETNDEIIRYSKEDWGIIESYGGRLGVSVDSRTKVITVETLMPDPVAAAKTTNLLVKRLTERIVKYKVEKAENSLQFIQERFQEAKEEYELNQSSLAIFTDRNRNLSNSIIKTEYERLQNQMNISFEVYKGLASQLEQAKIQVKEETPVFTILDPVIVPMFKSQPKRTLILFLFTAVGLFFSIVFLTLKAIIIK